MKVLHVKGPSYRLLNSAQQTEMVICQPILIWKTGQCHSSMVEAEALRQGWQCRGGPLTWNWTRWPEPRPGRGGGGRPNKDIAADLEQLRQGRERPGRG